MCAHVRVCVCVCVCVCVLGGQGRQVESLLSLFPSLWLTGGIHTLPATCAEVALPLGERNTDRFHCYPPVTSPSGGWQKPQHRRRERGHQPTRTDFLRISLNHLQRGRSKAGISHSSPLLSTWEAGSGKLLEFKVSLGNWMRPCLRSKAWHSLAPYSGRRVLLKQWPVPHWTLGHHQPSLHSCRSTCWHRASGLKIRPQRCVYHSSV